MKQSALKLVLRSIICLTFTVSIFVLSSCEPSITIRVRNYTDETLQIYYGETFIDDVAPKGEVKFNTLAYYPEQEYPIIAKGERGNIVYSKVFSRTDIKKVKYRVVIPATVEGVEQADNVTEE